jgi:hypothetical protein
MIAKLEFQLDDFDDRQAHLRCVQSTKMAIALSDILNLKKNLDNKISNNYPLDIYEALDMVFEDINNILNEYNLVIDELIS